MIFNLVVTVNRPGQCTNCGAFRLDGKQPTVHFTRCGAGPDGSHIGALRADGRRWREWREAAPPELTESRRRTRQ